MSTEAIVLTVIVAVVFVLLSMTIKIVKQYEQGVVFRLGRVTGARQPGLRTIIPFVEVMHQVSRRIVTMPIQSQGIITRDNVSVDVSAVAYFRVTDTVKSVVAIENVYAAIDQIAHEYQVSFTLIQHLLQPGWPAMDIANEGDGHARASGLSCAAKRTPP